MNSEKENKGKKITAYACNNHRKDIAFAMKDER
jgi:hypothetical protein